MRHRWAAVLLASGRSFAGLNALVTRVTVLPALVLILLTACGGSPPTNKEVEQQAFDDLRDEVRETINDGDRQAAVIDVVDQLQVEFSELRRIAEDRRKAVRSLNNNYDATREEFVSLLEEFAAQRTASYKKFRDVRVMLQESVTAEEWANIEGTNTKAMADLARLIAAI